MNSSGDPDLFLEDQPGGHHQLLLDDGDDQHPALLVRHWHRLDRHAKGHALDCHLTLPQRDLGHLVPFFDPGADHDPATLDLALGEIQLFFGQRDALGLIDVRHGLVPSKIQLNPP